MSEQNLKDIAIDIERSVKPKAGGTIISYSLHITNLSNNFIQLLEIQVNDNKLNFDVNILDEGAEVLIVLGQTGAVTQRQGALHTFAEYIGNMNMVRIN
ncbi:hypothetical protein [Pantanalinema sp. GBBB05]|uniref:hypothetical protein n=1 Tax=Pantanalinema sp. GBBB05 TaxID=2604139 RepID=UPI001D977D23|nr:hypothetical protein [Pantanalinema sp. GBBB05]